METLINDCVKMDSDLLMLLDERIYRLEEGLKRYYLISVKGNSMNRAGIESDCVLIADAYAKAQDGDIVIAKLADGWTLKRVYFKKGYTLLLPESNESHRPRVVRDGDFFEIAGVVRAAVKDV